MKQIADDYIIRSMERTGYPPWMQETMDGFDDDEPERIYTEAHMTVLSHIMFGKDNAIKRSELVSRTGLRDRHIRQCIEDLRKDYIILNDQDGMGYYRPKDASEVRRYYKQELGRALSIMARLKPCRSLLRREGKI